MSLRSEKKGRGGVFWILLVDADRGSGGGKSDSGGQGRVTLAYYSTYMSSSVVSTSMCGALLVAGGGRGRYDLGHLDTKTPKTTALSVSVCEKCGIVTNRRASR